MEKDQLLAEIEDILRRKPPREDFETRSEEGVVWVGRAAAAITRWDMPRYISVNAAVDDINTFPVDMTRTIKGLSKLTAMLQQARADLRMDVGPLSVVIQKGQTFDYFEEVRKVIETARSDVFFVDPYLDADFVSRYLPYVAKGTTVRLLGGPKRMATLLPAVDLFRQQSGIHIQVRSSKDIHDRYLFVDRAACYLSGASFKDGAKFAPAVLTQITDAFPAMWNTYDNLWNSGNVER